MIWQIKKLGDVVGIQNGFAFKSSEYVDSGFFVMRITNVQDGYIELNNPHYIKETNRSFRNFVLSEGDILMSLTGNVGRIGVIKKEHLPAVLNQRVARLFVKDKSLLDKDYLLNFLRSPKFFNEVVAGGKGMAQQNVSTKDIENLEISFPSLKTQKEIVAKLNKKFEILRKAKQLREEAIADTEKILSQTLHEIFENINITGINLGDVGNMISGGTPSRSNSDYWKGDISWVSSGELNNIYIFETKEKITQEGLRNSNTKLLPINTLMIGMYDSAALKMSISKNEMCTNQAIIALLPNEKFLPEFIYYQLTYLRPQVMKMRQGVRQMNLNSKMIKSIDIKFPSLTNQKQIVGRLDALSEKLQSLRELQASQLADLKALEKAYLREAFSGGLDYTSEGRKLLQESPYKFMAKKATSPKVAKVASTLLRNKQSSVKVKQVSGSALSQREKAKSKKRS